MPHDDFDDDHADDHLTLIGALLMGVAALLVVVLLVAVTR